MTLPAVSAWLSPHDHYQTVADVVADLETLRRKTRGTHQVRVVIPTMYGPWYQGSPGIQRTIGDELSPADADGINALTLRFALAGYPCDGWCVPLDPADGKPHGIVGNLFRRFYLNTEWGWDSFWRFAGDVAAVNAYLQAFTERHAADKTLGWTMVPNSMLDVSTDAELLAWAQRTDLVALETYLPGDRNLDPYKGLNRWFDRAGRLGITQPATLMVEHGNLADYLANLTEPEYGIHLWTLASTAAGIAALPDSDVLAPVIPPVVPEDEIDRAWLSKKDAVVGAAGRLLERANQMEAETRRRTVRKTVIRGLAAGVRSDAQEILA